MCRRVGRCELNCRRQSSRLLALHLPAHSRAVLLLPVGVGQRPAAALPQSASRLRALRCGADPYCGADLPYVVGQIREVASLYYDTTISVQVLSADDDGPETAHDDETGTGSSQDRELSRMYLSS